MQFKPREHPDARARKLNALVESVSSAGDAAAHAAAAQASAQAAAASLVLVQAAQTSASDAATQAQSSAVLAQAGAQTAADSVDAAAIHAQNAEFAKQLADQARADAQGAFDAANAAKAAALQAANDSATSAASALGSATSAAGQATIVEQRASEVELFASSATAAANIAALKSDASNANAVASSVSSTSAQVSATDAGISAAAAYQSELNASVASSQSGASADAAALSAASAAASQTAAGNSASAAQTSATNAATSANNANTSASQASTSATQASTSASNAASSEAAAATSATNAANSATAAGGSATAAANSASSAATSSSAAQSAATSATSSANTASTQAANASSSASAAATSASQASSSSTAAGSSAAAAEASKIAAEAANTSAQSAASASSASAASASASAASASTQATLSATFAAQSTSNAQALGLTPNARFQSGMESWFSGTDGSAPPVTGWGNWNATFNGADGVWKNIPGSASYIYSRLIPINTNRKYRIRGRVYSSGHAGIIYIGATSHDGNGATIGGNAGHNYIAGWAAVTKPVGWHDIEGPVITGEGATSEDANWFRAGTKQCRILAFLNYNGDSSQVWGLDSLWLEDVTETENAAGQAAIATSQASIATSQAATASSAASSATTQANLSASYSALSQGWGNTRGITPNGNFGAGKTNWTQPSNFTHNATLSGRSDVISSTTRLDGLTVDNASLVNIDTSRKYRVRAGFRVLSGSTPMVFYIGFGGYDQNRNYLTHNDGTFNYPVVAGSTFTSAQGWLDLVSPVITGEGMGSTLFPVGSKYVTPVFYGDYNNTGQGWALDYLFIEDVTESEAAAGQAGIATTQAGIANSQRALAESARAAAESASSLSATYRDQAQGHANSASSSASAASSSAASASASAATASTQATLSSSFSLAAAVAASESYPSDFTQDGKFFTQFYGTEASAPNIEAVYGSIAYVNTANGRVARYGGNYPQGSYPHTNIRKRIPVAPNIGRWFRITARARLHQPPPSGVPVRLITTWYGLTADYAILTYGGMSDASDTPPGIPSGDVVLPTDGSIVTAGVEFRLTTPYPDVNGNTPAYVHPGMYFLANDGGVIGQCDLIQLKVEDITSQKAAASSASFATTQATSASASAASAAASATLAASIVPNSRNRNPNFAVWNSPTDVADWSVWDGAEPTRVTGITAQYAANMVGPANASCGQYQSITFAPGWYVTEAEVTLVSGSFVGAGVHCHSYLNGVATNDYSADSLFAKLGAGVVGRTYRVSWLRQWTANCNTALLYAMTHWANWSTTPDANSITWSLCSIRPATEQEIRDQTVLAPLEATVTSHSSAIATLDTRTASYLTKVSAGAGTAELAMVATDSGGSPASSITLKADKIRLGSLTQPALEIVGGVSTFNGELNVGGSSGARVNITKDLIRVFDASGVLRVRLGIW